MHPEGSIMDTALEGLNGSVYRAATLFVALAATLSAGAQADRAPIVGTWENQVYFADCESGETSGDSVTSLHTYFADGNLEEVSLASSPVFPTTSGWGTWKKAGKGVFASTVRIGIMDVNGTNWGYMVRDRMTTLAQDKQSLEYRARVNLYTIDGQLLSSNCAQATGVRLPEPTPF